MLIDERVLDCTYFSYLHSVTKCNDTFDGKYDAYTQIYTSNICFHNKLYALEYNCLHTKTIVDAKSIISDKKSEFSEDDIKPINL